VVLLWLVCVCIAAAALPGSKGLGGRLLPVCVCASVVIRIRSDPKLLAGSGSEMNLK
jgi:hypothetical protein